MPRIGADPHQLRSLADWLDRAAGRLELIHRRSTGALDRAEWTGPDADAFTRTWRAGSGAGLRRSSASCRAQARSLRAHAADQEHASEPPAPPGASQGPAPVPGPLERPTPAVLDAPVRRSERIRLGGEGSLALLGIHGDGELQVDQLVDGRLEVTLSESVGGGLIGRGPAPVSGSHLRATAGGTLRRSWTIDAEALPGLLATLAVDAGPLGAGTRALDDAAGAADAVLARVGIRTDLDAITARAAVPEPGAVERLAAVGTAGAVAIGPARLGTRGAIAVGRRRDAAGERTVVEWSQDTTTSLRGDVRRLLGRALGAEIDHGVDARIHGRIEVPAGDREPGSPVRIRIESVVGDDLAVAEAVLLDAPTAELARSLRAPATAVGSIDPAALTALLAEDAGIHWRVTGYQVEHRSGTVPWSAGIAGLGASGTWERRTLR